MHTGFDHCQYRFLVTRLLVQVSRCCCDDNTGHVSYCTQNISPSKGCQYFESMEAQDFQNEQCVFLRNDALCSNLKRSSNEKNEDSTRTTRSPTDLAH